MSRLLDRHVSPGQTQFSVTIPLPLASGWKDWGQTYASPTVSRQGDIVILEGLPCTDAKAPNSVIANLPEGFRPSKRLIFPANVEDQQVRVDVLPNGQIIFVIGVASVHKWVSLSGIIFTTKQPFPEDAGDNKTDPIPVDKGDGKKDVEKDGFDLIKDGGVSPSGSTVVKDGVIHLTEAVVNQFGGIFFNTIPSSSKNISFSFDYFSGNGTGADGFCFFLADGAQHDGKTLGYTGGNLGYVGNPGVPFAYLGIGFDEYGNFGNVNDGKTPSKDMVLIRGGANATVGYKYPLLAFKSVAPQSIDGGWRNARIELDFVGANSTVVSVKLRWYKNGTDNVTEKEVVVFDKQKIDQANISKPATFRIGLAAATGGDTNQHYVKNLKILYRDQ